MKNIKILAITVLFLVANIFTSCETVKTQVVSNEA